MKITWSDWWKVLPTYFWFWDLSTNSGYNNYEEKLHTFRWSIFSWQWYTLT